MRGACAGAALLLSLMGLCALAEEPEAAPFPIPIPFPFPISTPSPLLDEAASAERPLEPADRAHWSFLPLDSGPAPAVEDADWPRNELDHFILARLESRGLRPLPAARRETLLRRLHLDLTGLPPSEREQRAFAEDRRPGAWERAVDRALSSPDYGAAQARAWLDLARFAESDGFEHDQRRPSAWKYRDWLIDALDRDLPYDRFVREQLAGDLLEAKSPGARVATGFLLAGPDMPDINSQVERRDNVLNDLVSTVGAVFLGLRLKCCQCHDHRSDALSQADFYRFRAAFDSAELFRPSELPEGGAARRYLTGPLRSLAERSAPAEPSRLRIRGQWDRPGPRLVAAVPRALTEGRRRLGRAGPSRLELARWLTSADRALALRTIANRIWQGHFGRGLVATPSDLGRAGARPSHPRLLDWLARELVRRGFRRKSLHRLILTSATYRQASGLAVLDASRVPEEVERGFARLLREDPDNRLLARYPRWRLPAEHLRDSLLAVAGSLSPRRGGPGVMPPLPDEIRKSVRKDHWKVSPDPEDHRRRSVYLFRRRNLRLPFFAAFDRPLPLESCARRFRATVPTQALALLNSRLSLAAARRLAGWLGELPAAERVERAWRRVLARDPSAEERRLANQLLRGVAEGAGSLPDPWPRDGEAAEGGGLVLFSLSLLNLAEFIWVD